ncbi:hypothetical protein [Elizabethkingia miricola]|uniref:hypothetical protein n=1 Tax=Elizabethkingia miricola TaxID=172045 RepID=UPI0009D1901F|nr:hypothetical protein [Elizabethkingia miricola]OPC34520.1 hypothetical protein BAX99_06520 [Elizabethkingia miricola]
MKRYDEIKNTNISGINNPIKNNLKASSDKGSFLFQNKGSYVEFKVRSQIVTEQNGEKWVIYPKVENNQVIGLIMSTLKEKETLITFDEIKSDGDYYKQLLPLFQDALNRYNKKRISLALNASIKPMAIGGEGAEPGGGGTGCGDDVQKCGNIEEVIVPGKPKQPVTPPTVPIGVSSCWDIANCPTDPGSDTGGGGAPFPNPSTNPNQEIINNLKDYPCAQNLLEKLPNLNNDLAKLIKEALGENNKDIQVNFFGETFADPDLQGETRKVSKIGDVITKYDIALSDAMLKRSTQEYILATMYHEFIHAYLGYEFIQLKADAYHAKYPYLESYIVGGERKFKFIIGDHQAYTPFVNMIADAIQSFNPSFPRERAISLAMEGLTDEGLPLLNQSYNKSERQGDFLSKGTKCSK